MSIVVHYLKIETFMMCCSFCCSMWGSSCRCYCIT